MVRNTGAVTRIDLNLKNILEWEVPKERREKMIDNKLISARETSRMLAVLLKNTTEGNKILNDLKQRPRRII